MRVLLSILVLLPIVWAASIDKRILLDGAAPALPSIDGAAKMLLGVVGSDKTREHCVSTLCPNVMASFNIEPFTALLCNPVCDQLQYMIQDQVSNLG